MRVKHYTAETQFNPRNGDEGSKNKSSYSNDRRGKIHRLLCEPTSSQLSCMLRGKRNIIRTSIYQPIKKAPEYIPAFPNQCGIVGSCSSISSSYLNRANWRCPHDQCKYAARMRAISTTTAVSMDSSGAHCTVVTRIGSL